MEPSNTAPATDLQAVLERIRTRLTAETRARADVVFGIVLSGPGAGAYTIDARKESGQGLLDGPPEQYGLAADAIARMSSTTFVQLATGQQNPQIAMMTGKLKVQGNMFKAMYLEEVLL
jgi:hypothetical protein